MPRRLTSDQVVDILGPLDDLRLAEILGTGATPAEVIEAKRWVAGYKRTLGDGDDMRPSIVTRLCDLIRAEDPGWDEQ